MPHTLSAKKRLRQNEERRIKNKSVRSEVKTWVKRLVQAVEAKDKELAQKYFRMTVSQIDRSVKKGVFHANTGARRKSHCAKLVSSLD